MLRRYLLKFGGRELILPSGRYRIGRDPSSDVRLDDEKVSRNHASLWVEEAGVAVEDHASRNGVRVNDERVYRRTALRSGDIVEIGGERFELIEDDPAEREPLAVPTQSMPRPGDTSRSDDGLALLSPREREVLGQLAAGFSAREIGEKLDLSAKTVETYRGRIGEKLGLRSRHELIRFALNTGLLRPESPDRGSR